MTVTSPPCDVPLFGAKRRPYQRNSESANTLATTLMSPGLWITGVRAAGAGDSQKGDPSAPAVWFPFQDTSTKNHIGMWSVNVTTYVVN